MKTHHTLFIGIAALLSVNAATALDLPALYQGWNSGTPITGNATRGKQLWDKNGASGKSCASCHNSNLTTAGKHVKTKKKIDALAPRANSKRLTKAKNINKWLKRNCKFVYNRECTTKEKVDFIEFIRTY